MSFLRCPKPYFLLINALWIAPERRCDFSSEFENFLIFTLLPLHAVNLVQFSTTILLSFFELAKFLYHFLRFF